jgi:CheY-like chemotaxis protein
MVDDANTGLAGTILVIDDERNIRRTLRMVLEGEGATVLDAETAEAGLELIQRSLADSAATQPIQVVMADVLLPGMSGLQLLEQLSGLGGGTPPRAGHSHQRARDRLGRGPGDAARGLRLLREAAGARPGGRQRAQRAAALRLGGGAAVAAGAGAARADRRVDGRCSSCSGRSRGSGRRGRGC